MNEQGSFRPEPFPANAGFPEPPRLRPARPVADVQPEASGGRGLLISLLIILPVITAGVAIGVMLLINSKSSPSSSSDVDWAKEIGNQYLEALAIENDGVMRSLSTSAHAKTIKAPVFRSRPKFTIESHTFSPSGDQISFKGRMEVRLPTGRLGSYSFSMLMEKEAGRWKVAAHTPGPFLGDPREVEVTRVSPTPTAWPSPRPTPSPTPPPTFFFPTPTPTPTFFPSPTPTFFPTPTPTPTFFPSATVTPTPFPSPTPTPTFFPSPTAIPTPFPTPTSTPFPSPTATPIPLPSPTFRSSPT